MKNLLTILGIFVVFLCKAQQYPLDTDFTTIPNNSYLKDTNNSLLPYVGNWKANYNGNEMVLKIEKVDYHLNDFGVKRFYEDVLFIRYSIKNSQGAIIETTMNLNVTDAKIFSDSIFPNESLVSFTYTGGKCTVGWGGITLQSIDSTHLKWNYQPESTIITNKNCSDYPASGIKINLPYEPADIIFTKQ